MNDLSLHIIDIIQNSLSAGALFIRLTVDEDINEDRLTIIIEDNGKGMTQEQVAKLSDPFFTSRTTRRVGMGIPLFKQSANQGGGDLKVESTVGEGTVVTAWFQHSNIDRPPLGDVANAFLLMLSANPSHHFVLKYLYNENEYLFDSEEVKEILGDIPFNDASIIRILTDMIRENLIDLRK